MGTARGTSWILAVALLATAAASTTTGWRNTPALAGAAEAPDLPLPRPEFWAVSRQVVEALRDHDLRAWADALPALPTSEDPTVLTREALVLTLAGRAARLGSRIDALGGQPEAAQRALFDGLAHEMQQRGLWRAARDVMTRAPYASMCASYVARRWAEAQGADVVDRWLAAQVHALEEPWWWVRLEFRRQQGTARALLDEQAARVRAAPADLQAAERWVRAAGDFDPPVDARWLATTCRFPRAFQWLRLGQALRGPQRAPARVAVLERALETPLAQEDLDAFDWPWQRPARAEQEAILVDTLKAALLEAYKDAGRGEEAQAVLLDLASRHPDGLPRTVGLRMAGEVQALSGYRVIETRVREKEQDPQAAQDWVYWLDRARYFTGRREAAQALAAFERAWALVPPAGPTWAAFGGRWRLLEEFAHWHVAQGAWGRGLDLVRAEFDAQPPGGDYAEVLMQWMTRLDPAREVYPDPGDEHVWAFLAAQPSWQHFGRLLGGLARHAQGDVVWARATQLAAGRDATRGIRLGAAMIGCGRHAEAAAVLLEAGPRVADRDREEWLRRLWDARIGGGQWRMAQLLLPLLREHARALDFEVHWFGELATCAARAGAREAAMGFWAQRCNFDPASTSGLRDMRAAGMGARLVAFYRAAAAADPENVHWPEVLRHLGGN